MRPIVHDTIHRDRPLSWIGIESGNNGACARQRRGAGREYFIDDCNLRRMDGYFAGKAVAACLLRFPAQRSGVAKVDGHGIERGYLRCCGSGETKRPRETVRIEKAAVRVAIRLGAELDG